MPETVRGSCLCGSVRFEVTLPFLRVNHCHCRTCQKHSGSAHESSGRVTPDMVEFTAGRELVSAFQPAPGEGNKAFCSRCGSSLFGGDWPDGPYFSVRLGALDEDPGQKPTMRTFVSSNAPWYDLPDDGLERHERGAP